VGAVITIGIGVGAPVPPSTGGAVGDGVVARVGKVVGVPSTATTGERVGVASGESVVAPVGLAVVGETVGPLAVVGGGVSLGVGELVLSSDVGFGVGPMGTCGMGGGVGLPVSSLVGLGVSSFVGTGVSSLVGNGVASMVGFGVGESTGIGGAGGMVGLPSVGDGVTSFVSFLVGDGVTSLVGSDVGPGVTPSVGPIVPPFTVGPIVGTPVSTTRPVGAAVISSLFGEQVGTAWLASKISTPKSIVSHQQPFGADGWGPTASQSSSSSSGDV